MNSELNQEQQKIIQEAYRIVNNHYNFVLENPQSIKEFLLKSKIIENNTA